jgi:hypothetical protein
MGTGHLIRQIDFSRARVVCLADVDATTPITSFIRLEIGEVRWSGRADFTPELVACYISDGFEPSVLTALSESSAPHLINVLVHPSLQRWSGIARLQKFFAKGNRLVLITVAVSRVDFESKLRRLIQAHRLDYEHQLNSVLAPEVGQVDISSWKRQFSDAGEKDFPRKILPCVRALAVAEIAIRLRFDDLDGASHFAVLSGSGSDLILLRCWQAIHGTYRKLRELSEVTQHAQTGESILIFVDAIHSGEQLISSLSALAHDLQRKTLKVVVRPAYATNFGIRRAQDRLANTGIIFDTQSAMVLQNVNPETEIKKSELELKLTAFAVEDATTQNIIKFCRRIGAELKAIEDETGPDFNVGLGGFGLGLTTLLAGRPSKGLLPILRLGGEVTNPHSGRRIAWKPLIQHKNISGVG